MSGRIITECKVDESRNREKPILSARNPSNIQCWSQSIPACPENIHGNSQHAHGGCLSWFTITNEITMKNNGVSKTHLSEISRIKTHNSPKTLTARTPLLTNMLQRSCALSPFHHVRGYSPSILDISPAMVMEKNLTANMKITASKALQNILKFKIPCITPPSMPSPGRNVCIFHRTSKESVFVERVSAKIIEPKTHYIFYRRSERTLLRRLLINTFAFDHRASWQSTWLKMVWIRNCGKQQLPRDEIDNELRDDDNGDVFKMGVFQVMEKKDN